MSTQRKTRNSSSSRGSGNGRGSNGSNGRGTRGSTGRVIHGGNSGTATPRATTTTTIDPNNPKPDMWKRHPYYGFVGGQTAGGDLANFINGSSDLTHIQNLFQSLLNGNTNASQLLAALLQGTNREDWSDESYMMIMQYLFSLMSTSDQRNYDWTMLQDSRQYNNPTNELARLMGAGISRDAALQILSGSAGNVGGAGAGSMAPVPTPTGTPGQMQLQRDAFIRDTVFSTVSAFSGLVDLGFSIPQAFQQVKFMKNQNFLNDEQIKAYQLSSQAYNIIKSSGSDISDDVFSSVGNVGDFLTSLANDGNTAAQQFISSGGLDGLRTSSPYSSPMLAQLYKDERSARDYNEQFRNNMDLMRAQTDLQKVNTDHLRTDIAQIEQNINNLRASEQYTIAQTNLAKKTEELTGKQIELTGVQTLTEKETLYSLGLQNDLEESWRNSTVPDGRTGLQLYSDYQLQRLYGDVMQLTTLNSKDAWTKQADSILASYENSIALYELGVLYANGEIDTMIDSDQQTLDLLNFCRAAEKSGLFPYIQAVATGETAGHMNIGPVGMSEPSKRAQDIYVGIDERTNKRKKWRK